jgi:hypothetical protein
MWLDRQYLGDRLGPQVPKHRFREEKKRHDKGLQMA